MQEGNPPTANDVISVGALLTALGALGKWGYEWLKGHKSERVAREDQAFVHALAFLDRLEKANQACEEQIRTQAVQIEELQRRSWMMEYQLRQAGIEVRLHDSK